MTREATFTAKDTQPDSTAINRWSDATNKLASESISLREQDALKPRSQTGDTGLPGLTIQNKAVSESSGDDQAKGSTSHNKTIPHDDEFSDRLVNAIERQAKRMRGTGHCAKAVQRALASVGMPQFSGIGNAWDMLSPLEGSGKFVRISENEAEEGDLIVRPPSRVRARHSKYGDISVVTSRDGDMITQTNDASYNYVPDNPRYDGKAVFLRYVSGKVPEQEICTRDKSK